MFEDVNGNMVVVDGLEMQNVILHIESWHRDRSAQAKLAPFQARNIAGWLTKAADEADAFRKTVRAKKEKA